MEKTERKPIYTITCLEKLEENNTWPEFGATAFQGFYYEKEDAETAVENNAGDIAERCYNYAIIETIEPGLYPISKGRKFYKYNVDKDIYEPMEEPAFMKHFSTPL